MTIRLGVLGLGSVFSGPYASLIQRLDLEGTRRAHGGLRHRPREAEADRRPVRHRPLDHGPQAVIDSDDVDAVLVLTSMNEHGSLAKAGARGRQARAGREADGHLARRRPRELVEAQPARRREALSVRPHIVLSPTYREMHRRVQTGEIGRLLLARARYGWSGPWWGRVVLPAGRRRPVRPRRLQPDQPVRLLRLGASG